MRLRDEIRTQVAALANLMMWANSQRNSLANQSSTYGHCEKALRDIIVMEFGQAVYNAIQNSRNGWNFGGNGSWLEDVEAAIENAQDELREELLAMDKEAEQQENAAAGMQPKANHNDKPGSPQTSIRMKLQSGRETSCIVCEGADGKSFRIVLDDVIHPIESGETLESAVIRQQAAWTRRIWNEWPNEWVIDENEILRTTLEGF